MKNTGIKSTNFPLHQTIIKMSASLRLKKKKKILFILYCSRMMFKMHVVALMKAANQSTVFSKLETTFTSSVPFLLELDNPILFVTAADSILSSCLRTCPA